jgi:hypothetical protein
MDMRINKSKGSISIYWPTWGNWQMPVGALSELTRETACGGRYIFQLVGVVHCSTYQWKSLVMGLWQSFPKTVNVISSTNTSFQNKIGERVPPQHQLSYSLAPLHYDPLDKTKPTCSSTRWCRLYVSVTFSKYMLHLATNWIACGILWISDACLIISCAFA